MTERDTELHGCWRLISFTTELQDSNARIQPWGADPNGYLVFGSDGRMMVLVTYRRGAGARDHR
ncbi:lipocalin-like domain-containing protein [Paraburkholderia caffeinilytica]|uniref:lipocalin-like domain-containing protein n=1 Tax=Paraburkholderia caffeinilytica TaxID=1761016 RepID=UPI0014681351|nr:lipocalin-like domain-containing protein [Paraburkholderia caffeinilytica]CAB3782272.1 hypothetical protein LMG28690_01299 [Paraburkholderia caffeinilytica]